MFSFSFRLFKVLQSSGCVPGVAVRYSAGCLIALAFKYRTDTVKSDYDQCMDDQDYLNRRYCNLTIERDQLQASEKIQIKKVQTLEKLLLVGR